MKKVLLSLYILCALSLSHSLYAQDQVVKDWMKGVQNENMNQVRKLCTSEFWNSEYDSGKKMYDQCVRKKLIFHQQASRVEGKRAVLTLGVYIQDRKADEVYLYLVQQKNKQWLIDGIDESEGHILFFLNEQVSGHYHPANLPSSPELEAVAESWLQGEDLEDRFPGLVDLELISTHYDKSLERGALMFKGFSERFNSSDTMCFYVQKTTSGRWYTYKTTYGRILPRGFFAQP